MDDRLALCSICSGVFVLAAAGVVDGDQAQYVPRPVAPDESGRVMLGRVAERAGFGSQESLRRHFRLIVGVTPMAYQKRFRGTAKIAR